MTAEDMRYWITRLNDQAAKHQTIYKELSNQALRWEGKYRIVCHENNQLRKKLTKNTPP